MRLFRLPELLALPFLAACGEDAPVVPDDPDTSVVSIEVEESEIRFDALGEVRQLVATPRDGSGAVVPDATVEWTTEMFGVVTLTADGAVTSVGNGTAVVTASVGDVSADVTITVDQIAVALRFGSTFSRLTVIGGTAAMGLVAEDAGGGTLDPGQAEWSTSNPDAVRVDPDGIVTAVAPGTAVISAAALGFTVQRPLEVLLSGPAGGALVGEARGCASGFVGPFPCGGVELLAYLPLGGLGIGPGGRVTDLWGWADPLDGREVAIVQRLDGTSFVDVTDPLHPVLLGSMPQTAGSPERVWRDVKVYRNHAYIVSDAAGAHGVQIFDLTRLRAYDGVPLRFEEDGHYSEVFSAHNIAINEDSGVAYSVGGNSGGTTCGGGLHMFDLSTPTSPGFLGCFAHPGLGRAGTGYVHDAQCVVYAGPDVAFTGREICFNSNENAMSVVDVTDPSNGVLVSRATYPNVRYAHQGWLTDDQRWFYTNDELDETDGLTARTRMLIWDVSELEDPILAGEYLGPTPATDHNIYVRGDRLYQSNYEAGIRILDITDRVNPVEIAFLDTDPGGADAPGFDGSWSNYPFFASGIVVVASGREGLFVIREAK